MTDGDIEIILLGTGSPLPSPDRCGNGQVIRTSKATILIDCGWGVARKLPLLQVPVASIDAVFFTHLHSDHITDFADLLMQGWTGGRRAPLPVYGPEDTAGVVEGFRTSLIPDVRYRLAHHGEKLWDGGTACDVHEITADANAKVIAKVGDLEVSVFEVDHRPVYPAFGFKITNGTRTVVFSGDTRRCDALVAAAKGADLLVSEILHEDLLRAVIENQRKMGNTLAGGLLTDAIDYHALPGDVAEMAQEAGVKRLLLTHIIPPVPPGSPALQQLVAGMDDDYKGPIEIGHDLYRTNV
jgi:ribonuclease Z